MPELEEGRDYIIDTNGLLVLTAAYLLRRGYCCGNGCRNCPYDKVSGKPKRFNRMQSGYRGTGDEQKQQTDSQGGDVE